MRCQSKYNYEITYHQENAQELVELGGGSKELLSKAKNSFEERKYQWCLQLCDALIEINSETKEAKVV